MANGLKRRVVREPCEGKPHARFDDGELEKQVTTVRLFPTLHRLKAVATDRGFYSQANEEWLKEGGVKQVSIPVRG